MCEDLISRTKCFVFNGQRYRVFISHRRGIGGNLNPLYLLDANSQFSVVTERNNRKRDGDILYIGIGYQDGVDILKARTRDYTVPSGEKEFAEGAERQRFINLLPHALNHGSKRIILST